jgi:hypothetical protein
MPDDPVDDLSDRHMLGLGFSFNASDERPFDVQGPALGRGGCVIGVGQEMLAPAPLSQHVVNIRSPCVTVGDHTLY